MSQDPETKACPKCGGTHYPASDLCPYSPEGEAQIAQRKQSRAAHPLSHTRPMQRLRARVGELEGATETLRDHRDRAVVQAEDLRKALRAIADAPPELMHQIAECALRDHAALAAAPPEPKAPEPQPDEKRGLYQKYQVTRLHDPSGKHRECEFYVLDLIHDGYARAALLAYAAACEDEFPKLARDLAAKLNPRASSEETRLARALAVFLESHQQPAPPESVRAEDRAADRKVP